MEYYLGIDSGGSKTAALITNSDGQELGIGLGGPGSLAIQDEAELRHSLLQSIRGALKLAGIPLDMRYKSVCVGIAGYSAEQKRASYFQMLQETLLSECYRIEPDYLTAYWGASGGSPGIVVIAGTGAVSFGRNSKGETLREDGLGYLLGDRGSGFNLGLRVISGVLEEMKECRISPLSKKILEETETHSQNEIMQWLYGNFSTAKVAAIAPIVGEFADAGDQIARAHISEMARRLRHAVRQIRHRLWMPRDIPVYTLGGLWNIGSFFQEEFQDPQWRPELEYAFVTQQIPGGRFNITDAKCDALQGAALLAREECICLK